jgi:Ca-activated chloride channel homolog
MILKRFWNAAQAGLGIAALAGALAACDDGGQQASVPADRTLRILSGSENQTLAPIVEAYCRSQGWACPMTYQGSVDIKLALETPEPGFEAIWPAHSRWIDLGDKARRVSHVRSILQTPVVFAVRRDVARRLGLMDRPVRTAEIAALVDQGRLPFLMTSATQSNSGASFTVALMGAFSGSPEILTMEQVSDNAAHDRMRRLMRGVERTSGSSDWLKDLYLDGEGLQRNAAGQWGPAAQPSRHRYAAMVNYEALVVEANQVLEANGREPLYAIYPADGVAVADSPLGLLGGGPAERERFFLGLQRHLLSEAIQRRIVALGRRSALPGGPSDPAALRPGWGMDPERILPVIRFPTADVLERILNLWQGELRKPTLAGLCLDFSGSMRDAVARGAGTTTGEAELKAALELVFSADSARRLLLQLTPRDVTIMIPFSGEAWLNAVVRGVGPDGAEAMIARVRQVQANGGTDMYACAAAFLDMVDAEVASGRLRSLEDYAVALGIMTDGKSTNNASAFGPRWLRSGRNIPVFGITFGDADASQLQALATMTRGRVFDGRVDLPGAFRHLRGYQ